MGRTSLIILAAGCLCAPITALAQQSGGTGNKPEAGVLASAGAPTVEENIDSVRRAIMQARADKTISAHMAYRAEHKLMVIEHRLERLDKEVAEVRHSLP
jgi:hypothetical protein